MSARVIVFLDYQNVYLSAYERFSPPGGSLTTAHIDPVKVARLLVSRRNQDSTLVGVRVYRGQPNPIFQPDSAAASDRQVRAWTTASEASVVRRQLRYPKGWPHVPAREKGIDVALAVDFVRLAMQREYDVGILFSSDTDLMPALETVADLKLARVEVADWGKSVRLRFPGTNLPWCHHLTKVDYLAVADPTDYTKPGQASGR